MMCAVVERAQGIIVAASYFDGSMSVNTSLLSGFHKKPGGDVVGRSLGPAIMSANCVGNGDSSARLWLEPTVGNVSATTRTATTAIPTKLSGVSLECSANGLNRVEGVKWRAPMNRRRAHAIGERTESHG